MKNETAIWDARKLGIPKMLLLGLQHTFAMFGATVLVPIITGLDVSTTLLFAGLGHPALSPDHQGQGSGISRFLLCFSGRLCDGRAET